MAELNSNYKETLKYLKSLQVAGLFLSFQDEEISHICRILTAEGLSANDMSEEMLSDCLDRERLGLTNYSLPKHFKELNRFNLEESVNIIGHKRTVHDDVEELKGQSFTLSPDEGKAFLTFLVATNQLSFITGTLESMDSRWWRKGKPTLASFPTITQLKLILSSAPPLPELLTSKIGEWENQGCDELLFEFIDKYVSEDLERASAFGQLNEALNDVTSRLNEFAASFGDSPSCELKKGFDEAFKLQKKLIKKINKLKKQKPAN